MIYVLDTHALVWHLAGSPRLSRAAAEAIVDPKASLIVPSIVLGEIRYLALRNRVDTPLDKVLQFIDEDNRCSIHPLDRHVASRIPPNLNIHDALICATALVVAESAQDQVAVVTTDTQITASGIVATIW